MTTIKVSKTEATDALDAIKARFKTPGCCFVLSKGPFCECILCLCDRVREYIEQGQAAEPGEKKP